LRHLLTGNELTRPELLALLARAAELKREPLSSDALRGKTIALLFAKPSTRTRMSFEAGVFELGGHPMVLRMDDTQLTRGESFGDFARVAGGHAAAIGVRTHDDAELEQLAEHGSIPVFNMLTQGHHPCQALADLLTLQETFGTLEGLKVVYVGDGNNVARSLALLGAIAGVEVVVSAPAGYQLDGVTVVEDPREAARDAHALYTDVWISMGDEESGSKRAVLEPYRLDDELLSMAAPEAIALHCLPAHPGEEITPEVLYGPRQRIWDQAENRRHAQKAMLEWLLTG
jgi:ornithine carbamoyltransferase